MKGTFPNLLSLRVNRYFQIRAISLTPAAWDMTQTREMRSVACAVITRHLGRTGGEDLGERWNQPLIY